MGFESFDRPTIAWVVRFLCWQVRCEMWSWSLKIGCDLWRILWKRTNLGCDLWTCEKEWRWRWRWFVICDIRLWYMKFLICEIVKENEGVCDMWSFSSVKLWKKMEMGCDLWIFCGRDWRWVVWLVKKKHETVEKKRKKII